MVLYSLLSLSLLFSFSTKNSTLTQAQCLPDQRDALIQLKQGFNTTKLHSWNASTDCCIWDGIKCDKQIGMVTGINLSSSSISGEINLALFNLSSLQYLNLARNHFHNLTIPQIGFERLANLTSLDLSDSGFIGQVPIGISALTNLISLNLSHNYLNLHGTGLKTLLSNLTKLKLLHLSYVDISINGSEWGKAIFQVGPTLQQLAMGRCGLSGNFPDGIFDLTNLTKLDLSYNPMLSSKFPDLIGNLQNLTILDLEHCGLYGVIPPSITNITRLKDLNLGANRLTGPVPLLRPTIQFADFSFNYFSWPAYFLSVPIYLSLSENRLTGEIPLSLCNVTSPKFVDSHPSSKPLPRGLDLSFNNITGTMPPCLLEHAESYEVLNLQSNNLSGPLPRNINQECKLVIINLSGNRINGSLPQSLLNCDTLQILDLGNNQIVDRFPFWLGTLRNLRVLVLRSNQFYGPISNMEVKKKTNNSIFPTLKVFDVSSNHFSGIISKTFFENLKAMVSNSNSSGFEMGYSGHYYNQSSIKALWKGQDMEIIRSLSIFSSLDLSENGFSGDIPEEIGQLNSLDVLNLSHNALTGPIPSEFGNLHQLQSLDLSCNQLSGHIPQELTSLTFLSALNLSYNNMVGEIPQGHQFSTFQNNSYLDNPGLCGTPLSMQCATTPSNDGFNKDLPSKSSTDIIELSISIGLGLGVGFSSVICALVSWENGREQFNFIVDRFYFQHILWIVIHLRLAIGRE